MIGLATIEATAEYYRKGIPLSGPPVSFTTRTWEYPWVQEVLRRAGLAPPANLLDVGCACNPLMVELARQGYNVTGLDLYEKGAADNPDPVGWGFDRAMEGPNLRFKQGDIIGIPFPDGHFDCVYSVSVMEHITHWINETAAVIAVREMCRVLKPGGLLVVTEDYTPSPVEGSALIQRCAVNEEKGHNFLYHIEAAMEYGEMLDRRCAAPTGAEIDEMRDRGELLLNCAVHPAQHYHFTALGYALVKFHDEMIKEAR
jgi:SAM-dependent methyltransferase